MKARASRSLSTDDEAEIFLLLPPGRRHQIVGEALDLVVRSLVHAHRSGTVGGLVDAMVGHPYWRYLQHLSAAPVLGPEQEPAGRGAVLPPTSIVEKRPKAKAALRPPERSTSAQIEPRPVEESPISVPVRSPPPRTTASAFVLSMPWDMRPSDVVAQGAKAGLTFSENLVYKARGRARSTRSGPNGAGGVIPVEAKAPKRDLTETLIEYITERPGRRADEIQTHFGGDRLVVRAALDALSDAKKVRTNGSGRNATYVVEVALPTDEEVPVVGPPTVEKQRRARVVRPVGEHAAIGRTQGTVDAPPEAHPAETRAVEGVLLIEHTPALGPARAVPVQPDDLDAAVNALAQLLGESEPDALEDLRVVISKFGLELARAAFQKTVEIETGEGLVREGRRKTPGGVFFYFTKRRAGREVLGPQFADARRVATPPPVPPKARQEAVAATPARPKPTQPMVSPASPAAGRKSVDLVDAMVGFIAKNPGLREEEIRTRLAGDRLLVRATLNALRAQKRVRTTGSGRVMTYTAWS